MRETKINRRLVLTAFLLAVLVGAGGQAAALWSQNSTVTMQVTFSKLPPVSGLACASHGQSSKVTLSWDGSHLVGVTNYIITVSRNGVERQPVVIGSNSSYELTTPADVQAGDTLAVSVVAQIGNSGQTQPATFSGIKVLDRRGNSHPLHCA